MSLSPQTAADHWQHLRTLDTLDAGRAYLDGLRLSKDDLVAIAAVADDALASLARRGTKAAAVDLILNQAIGARRKYQGLRTW